MEPAGTDAAGLNGQYKPMRVEKPKRKRLNKVKQGAPSKLSASQKRKLARLYLYTSLTWEDILKLVMVFGNKIIRKRAVQTVLEGFLGPRYHSLRPMSMTVRKNRMSQITKCNDTRLARKRERCQPVNSNHKCGSQSHSGSTAPSFNDVELHKQDQLQIEDFDPSIDKAGRNGLERGFPDRVCSPPSYDAVSHDYLLSRMKRPTNVTLPPITEDEEPFFPCIDPLKSKEASEVLEIGSYPMLKPIILSACNQVTVRKEHSQLPITFLDPLENGDYPEGVPLDPYMALAANPISESGYNKTLKTRLTGSLPPHLSGFPLVPPDAPPKQTRSVVSSEGSRSSSLSSQIARLSKVSSEERDFIQSLLKHFSISTLPSLSSSMLSWLSIRFTQVFEGSMDEPLMFHPSRAVMKMRSKDLKLPGNFITKWKVETFLRHVACSAENEQSYNAGYYCEGCCQGLVHPLLREELCIPFSIRRYYDENGGDVHWSPEGLWWTDRFGNTALHIAAAMYLKYQQVREVIDHGVCVNALNSGGQTFLHLLNPRLLTVNEMFSLSARLENENFNFHQVDVQGQTFVDVFTGFGIQPLVFAQCWLKPLLKLDMVEHIVNYRFVKHLFESSGGSEAQWETLGWMESSVSDINPMPETTSSLSQLPLETLFLCRNYNDPEGRNYLHLSPYQPLTAESRHGLVKDLVAIGVDINHQDNYGETPLMAYIRSQHCEIPVINTVLESGANLNLRNNSGENPAHISIKLGNVEAMKALLAWGINVHARDREGRGLLDVALNAQDHAKDDVSLYSRIAVCMVLAVDAGAIASPNMYQEWDLRQEQELRRRAHNQVLSLVHSDEYSQFKGNPLNNTTLHANPTLYPNQQSSSPVKPATTSLQITSERRLRGPEKRDEGGWGQSIWS